LSKNQSDKVRKNKNTSATSKCNMDTLALKVKSLSKQCLDLVAMISVFRLCVEYTRETTNNIVVFGSEDKLTLSLVFCKNLLIEAETSSRSISKLFD